jgi:hypothetical protein
MRFQKLASYLDGFGPEDPDYDTVCFIKAKIAKDLQDSQTVNNGEEDDLEDNDITMSTPEQQSQDNLEGEIMGGAFKELDVLNDLKEEKEEVHFPGQEKQKTKTPLDLAAIQAFGDGAQNQKQASLFSLLQKHLRK